MNLSHQFRRSGESESKGRGSKLDPGGAERIDHDFGRLAKLDFHSSKGDPSGPVTSFSQCSTPYPSDLATHVARRIHKLVPRHDPLSKAYESIAETARHQARKLLAIPREFPIALFRNSTEAVGIIRAVALSCPLMSSESAAGASAAEIFLTDIEYSGTAREVLLVRDAGNGNRKDPISSWPNFYSLDGPRYESMPPRYSGLHARFVQCFGLTNAQFLKNLECQLAEHPVNVFACSHVDRHTGRVLPIKAAIDTTRQIMREWWPQYPEPFILIDGAQALGNVPVVDFRDLGCDAYVFSPHKTLRSEVVGVLALDPSTRRFEQLRTWLSRAQAADQIILKGSFPSDLKIEPNVEDSLSAADLAGFVAAAKNQTCGGFNGNDFSEIHSKRAALRSYFIERLAHLSQEIGAPCLTPDIESPSSFIFSFQFVGMRCRLDTSLNGTRPRPDTTDAPDKSIGWRYAQRVSNRGSHISYLDTHRILRVAFDRDHTPAKIDKMIHDFKDTLCEDAFAPLRCKPLAVAPLGWSELAFTL